MGSRGGIRPVDGPHKKIHVQARCEKCHHSETLSCYENDIPQVRFKMRYWGCRNCQKVFCTLCAGDHPLHPECPFCKKLKHNEIHPIDIYVMAAFFKKWLAEGGPLKEWESIWRI